MYNPLKTFKNSCNGLMLAWRDDTSFRVTLIQVLLGTAIATIYVLYTGRSSYTWLLLVASLFPMVIIEAVNSSIEAVTDKASPERHPLAKKAKDIASATVLLARILAAICWLVVFID